MAYIKSISFDDTDLPAYDIDVNPTEQTERLSYILSQALLSIGAIDVLCPDGEESEGEWLTHFYTDLISFRTIEGHFSETGEAVVSIAAELVSVIEQLSLINEALGLGGELIPSLQDIAASSGIVLDAPGINLINGIRQVNSTE